MPSHSSYLAFRLAVLTHLMQIYAPTVREALKKKVLNRLNRFISKEKSMTLFT